MSKRITGINTGTSLAGLPSRVQELRAELTPRQQLALFVFVAFLSIQLIVPVVELAGPRPQRFGWQMFAGSRDQLTFEVVQADGSARAVELADYIGYPRLELEYDDELVSHLCKLDHDTVAVRILSDGSDETEERSCQR